MSMQAEINQSKLEHWCKQQLTAILGFPEVNDIVNMYVTQQEREIRAHATDFLGNSKQVQQFLSELFLKRQAMSSNSPAGAFTVKHQGLPQPQQRPQQPPQPQSQPQPQPQPQASKQQQQQNQKAQNTKQQQAARQQPAAQSASGNKKAAPLAKDKKTAAMEFPVLQSDKLKSDPETIVFGGKAYQLKKLEKKEDSKKSGKPAAVPMSPAQEAKMKEEKEKRKEEKRKLKNLKSLNDLQLENVVVPGRHMCGCEGTRHNVLTNCTSCGRITCEQEGYGQCFHCGHNVTNPYGQNTPTNINIGGSNVALPPSIAPPVNPTTRSEHMLARAVKHLNRLLEYDRTAAARTTVVDDQADYFESETNFWLDSEERRERKQLETQYQDAKAAKKRLKFTIDFAGRRVLLDQEDNKETLDKLMSEMKISKRPKFTKEDLDEQLDGVDTVKTAVKTVIAKPESSRKSTATATATATAGKSKDKDTANQKSQKETANKNAGKESAAKKGANNKKKKQEQQEEQDEGFKDATLLQKIQYHPSVLHGLLRYDSQATKSESENEGIAGRAVEGKGVAVIGQFNVAAAATRAREQQSKKPESEEETAMDVDSGALEPKQRTRVQHEYFVVDDEDDTEADVKFGDSEIYSLAGDKRGLIISKAFGEDSYTSKIVTRARTMTPQQIARNKAAKLGLASTDAVENDSTSESAPKNTTQTQQQVDPSLVYINPSTDEDDQGLCLSMHQPWASMLVYGVKRAEGRSWYSPHRGRLWIASTVMPPSDESITELEDYYTNTCNRKNLPKYYPTGMLLGCVDVVECLSNEDYIKYREKHSNYFGVEASESKFVFVCRNPRKLIVPLKISGKHKIWALDKQTLIAAQAGLKPLPEDVGRSKGKTPSSSNQRKQ